MTDPSVNRNPATSVRTGKKQRTIQYSKSVWYQQQQDRQLTVHTRYLDTKLFKNTHYRSEMVLNSPSIFQILTAAAALGAATSTAQSIQQPTANTSVTSFSGQGSIPFQYTASDASAVSSVNVALVQDGLDFVLANGLLGDGGEYAAVFAPISGFCGDVSKSS